MTCKNKSSWEKCIIFLALLQVDPIIIFNLFHLLQFCLLYAYHLFHIKLTFAVIPIEVLFRSIVLINFLWTTSITRTTQSNGLTLSITLFLCQSLTTWLVATTLLIGLTLLFINYRHYFIMSRVFTILQSYWNTTQKLLFALLSTHLFYHHLLPKQGSITKRNEFLCTENLCLFIEIFSDGLNTIKSQIWCIRGWLWSLASL